MPRNAESRFHLEDVFRRKAGLFRLEPTPYGRLRDAADFGEANLTACLIQRELKGVFHDA